VPATSGDAAMSSQQPPLWEIPGSEPADTDTVLTMFVPGIPRPQGSKRYLGHRSGKAVLVEGSRESRRFRDRITWAAHDAWRPRVVLTGEPLTIALEFVMPRPVSTPKTTPAAVRRPDLDKLVRCVCDAMTGVIYADDSQIVHLVTHQRLARLHEPPGVHIELTNRAEAS
jgi:crossover junction endodeoxyribonuclease RusA